jgi:hypothetical protein
MQMSEIEREAVLAQRHDEMQQAVDKRNLDQMLKSQAAGFGRLNEDDSVSKAAKRVLNSSLRFCTSGLKLTRGRATYRKRSYEGKKQEVRRAEGSPSSKG